MSHPLVAVIVLNWRKPVETMLCLESLSRITYPNAQIIAVDNGSGDESVPLIRQRFPQITVLETGANLGYAGGNNVGVRWALERGAEFTLILNNDVIVDPGFIEPLIEASRLHPGPIIVTPVICELARPDIVWTIGADIDWRTGAPVRRHEGERREEWQKAEPHPVTFAPGMALLAPRAAWERAGPMDEAYFLYYEEADWCFHAIRAGCRILAAPQSCVWHDAEGAEGRTSPAITYYMTRNALRFLDRNQPRPQRWASKARVIAWAVIHSLSDLYHGQRIRSRARWRALLDYMAGRYGHCRREHSDMSKLVSIVMPTYNQAHFLPEALEGVFAQTYSNYELIVVDDGSTDNTADVLADYQQRYEFMVVFQENQRLPRALNAGFGRARGDFLTWTSSDNIMLPHMLEVLVEALDNDHEVGLVYADRYLMDDDGNDLGRFDLPGYDPYLLLHANLVHCCFLYRRECMERVGLFDSEFIYGEDWEYWIRISRYYAMKRVPQTLYRYRLHRTSMTSELVRGTADNIPYEEFARRIRRRMPVRWWIGKLKWRWLRAFRPDHPMVSSREAWNRASETAAQGAL